MRVLEFDEPPDLDSFTPMITIPANEAGDVSYATLQLARVADTYVDGQVIRDKVVYLSVAPDGRGT